MSKDKSKYSKQMFTVKCHVTDTDQRVRRSVFMNRVARVQRLVRRITGDQIGVGEAINTLSQNYVGIAGRKQANVDYLGQPIEFAQAMNLTRRPAKPHKMPRTPKAPTAPKPAPTPAPKAPAAPKPNPTAPVKAAKSVKLNASSSPFDAE
jgi:cell division protein FtsN